MELNNYALFYKTNKDSNWQSKRLDLPVEKWENYCKEQGYFEYDIKDLRTYDTLDLHLLTDVVLFNNKYFLPEEKIPYPENEPQNIGKFETKMIWENEHEYDESDYDEVYKEEFINWGWGHLWTNITTGISVNKDMDELYIVAQNFLADFPQFLEKLEQNNFAVYTNLEYTPFKWLCWIKNNNVRIIHQDYRFSEVKTEFDVLVDKEWFFHFGYSALNTMKEYAEADKKRYEKYVKEKYNKSFK